MDTLNNEPVVVSSSIGALVVTIVGVAAAVLKLDNTIVLALNALVAAAIAVYGAVVRSKVVPLVKLQKLAELSPAELASLKQVATHPGE